VHSRTGAAISAIVFGIALAACGGSGDDATGRFASPADLGGGTVGVVSLSDTAALQTRFVLQEAHGLGSDAVTLVEAPADALAEQLATGEIDAVVVTNSAAFEFSNDERFVQLEDVTAEMTALTGEAVMRSVLVTYPQAAEQKGDALVELNRLLAASGTYLAANRAAVIDALEAESGSSEGFSDWWWERHELPLGDLSAVSEARVVLMWEAARVVGDIAETPEPAGLLFDPEAEAALNGTSSGDRTTLSLAVLDGPNRREVLYALERGLVTSETIDVDVTYLRASELIEAAPARLYDVVETMPVVVPLGRERDLDLLVLSAGVVDRGGTLLFVRAE